MNRFFILIKSYYCRRNYFQNSEVNQVKNEAIRKYWPEIDGLRAVAVIAVIINHFNKDILPSGYLGVDIFFVISGYVITSSISGRSCDDFGNFLNLQIIYIIKSIYFVIYVYIYIYIYINR